MVRHLSRWTVELGLCLSVGVVIGNVAWIMVNVFTFMPPSTWLMVILALFALCWSAHHVGYWLTRKKTNRVIEAQQHMIEAQRTIIELQAKELKATVVVPIISIYKSDVDGEHGHMRLGPVCMN